MNTFTWFVVGHLVGDWLLQNDWMARNKRLRLVTAAGMAHFTVYTAAILGALLLSEDRAQTLPVYVAMLLVVFVSHWLIDATQFVEAWLRFYHQTNIPLVRVMVDQTFHLLVLAGVAALIPGV